MASFEIPKECLAGVVENEGPDFTIKVEMVPVPEPGELMTYDQENPSALKLGGSCGTEF
jgi:hypothetical protein